MTTLQKPARTTKTRTLRFTPNTDDMSPTAGLLTLTVGRDEDAYIVAEYPNGHVGRGFTLTKLGDDFAGYSVECGPRGDTCDCEGFKYRRSCKHTASVRLLLDSGRL